MDGVVWFGACCAGDRSLASARQRLHLPPPSPVFGTFITFINLAIQSLFTRLDSVHSL
ncbi:hypothetical protein EMIT0373P_60374 [Pseudomonas chlororaphis]